MIGGIAGVNPRRATLADVTLARYAVQVALQYEFDIRDAPANFSTGYVPFGAYAPHEYPTTIYGTEVFEFNDALRQRVAKFARQAKLNDSSEAQAYRAKYASDPAYAAGASPSGPSVRLCDVATSDNWFTGPHLSSAFDDYTTFVTNGTGAYCTTAQEDNGSAEALLRAAYSKLLDFSRIIVLRTASDMDRPYAGESSLQNLLYSDQGAFLPSLENIYLAGREIVHGIVNNWNNEFSAGIKATNYVGDIYDSLPSPAVQPDFGYPPQFLGAQLQEFGGLKKRSQMSIRSQKKRFPSLRMS